MPIDNSTVYISGILGTSKVTQSPSNGNRLAANQVIDDLVPYKYPHRISPRITVYIDAQYEFIGIVSIAGFRLINESRVLNRRNCIESEQTHNFQRFLSGSMASTVGINRYRFIPCNGATGCNGPDRIADQNNDEPYPN
ncbi:MAG: hypothetical protein OTJ43_04830 [Dehalococcoidia bacterium]|nr:hypothetical protein [Dehalococcoidia bacterium]